MLVHGFLDLAYGWHEVADKLAAQAHVIAVDLRGHGDSDWVGPGGYYHFLDYVADLDHVIARVARKRVVGVGHSMGGAVVAYWAGTRPDRPAAIALLEGLGPPDQSEAELGGRTAQWIEAWRTARAKVQPMPSIQDAANRLRKHDPLLGEDLARRLATAGTRASEGGFVWKHDPLHLTMGPYPFRRDAAAQYWRRITCPVLVVDGDKSFMNLPDSERAARRAEIRTCRHVTLAGAGHMMQRHQPAALAKLVADLL
ncbi:MAG: alpha/beta hydrolase fold protein [Myxococcales bacterium]|nr:alpha/beta hydrolase fold protein [Myxococcales bacterium]